MLAALVMLLGMALLVGAAHILLRTVREWRATITACRDALGGELTPGNLLHPPRLWLRTDDYSLVVGLISRGERGGRFSTSIVGRPRAIVASTRITVDGPRLPHDLAIYPAGPVPDGIVPHADRRVVLGIPPLDRRLRIEGSPMGALSRMGADRRSAIAAAVAQGAAYDGKVWAVERAEPITRATELIGLSRLLIAAAEALLVDDDIAEERLLASVRRDPEPGFRLRCLDALTARVGAYRQRAIDAALADPHPTVRLHAARAAGPAGRAALIALAEGPHDTALRGEAIAELARDDGPEVRALFERLALHGISPIRLAALRGMRRLGHAPVELLARFCRHPEPALRIAALRALRAAGPAGEAAAIAALDDGAAEVVRTAVETLAAIGGPAALPGLRGLRPGPLDAALKAAIERALEAIRSRLPRADVGQLALAGPDAPEAGQLAMADEAFGRLSPHVSDAEDLFADPPPIHGVEPPPAPPNQPIHGVEPGAAPTPAAAIHGVADAAPAPAGPPIDDLFADPPDPAPPAETAPRRPAEPAVEVSPAPETE